jgi:integrase
MQTKLNKRTIDSLASADQPYTLWDLEIPGFGIRVMPTGRKSFVLKFVVSGQQRWLTIGRYGDLTLEEARKIAQAKRGDVAKGEDPTIIIRARKAAPTVAELIVRFIEEHVNTKTRATTAVGYVRYLRKVIEPRLGRLLVRDLTSAEVAKFHHELRNTPRQANQAVAILRKMLNLAEVWGYRPMNTNPCIRIQKNPESKRERYLTDEELNVLGQVLAAAQGDGSVPPQAIVALRLLVLTGARHSEILKLRWDQVDLDRQTITLHADEHKTGKTQGTKTIPLNSPAMDLIRAIPRMLGNPYVISGAKAGSHFVGLQKCWERIKRKAGEHEADLVAKKKKVKAECVDIEDVRIHDLRHTFASVGVSHGFSLPVVGSLLGHSQPSVTQRYAHLAEDPRANASEEIAGKIAKALKGGTAS